MKDKTVKEINDLYLANELNSEMLSYLKNDTRQGVKNIIKKQEKKLANEKLIKLEFEKHKEFDFNYKSSGNKLIAGIDEAGRGPLAGPVVAASVILPDDFKLYGLTDSKQISKKNREIYYDYITEQAVSYSVEVIDVQTIDRINIFEATLLAMKNSYRNLHIKPDFLLVDAVELKVNDIPYDSIIKGDAKSLSIAAASILAKVSRDKIMMDYDHIYPAYKFSDHMGYGTKDHLQALKTNGISPIHRKSFSPIKELIN